MDKREITRIIEEYAPPETAETWDCSGWGINVSTNKEISTVMLCLTVTDDVIRQARSKKCDMIISHHPLFYVPLEWKDIDIYCAHTNLDKAEGGTTDTLIKVLELPKGEPAGEFLRIVNYECTVNELGEKLKKISFNIRLVNNKKIQNIKKIAFCAGSGSDFIQEACENGADVLVTGDVKFHTALESPIALFDIGHFESEKPSLNIFRKLLSDKVEIIEAEEKNPFKCI